MNKGFTKLEIILIGIIFIVAGGFFATKGLSLFAGNKFTLEQRFNKLISLQNDKNYSELYDNFIYPEEKTNLSKEEFISSFSKSKVIKSIPQINNIVIKGNIGYIDRSLTICMDESCSEKQTLRGYKKWIFSNGNWYVTFEEIPCLREMPYEKPSEFDRALSLIKQRYTDKFGRNAGNMTFFNCLDIQYTTLSEAEGLFTFDENKSSMERLTIYVDNSYKIKDDVLTSFLLSHEIFHAGVYLTKLNYGSELSCYDNEIQAFQAQLMFLGSLNQEEQDSLVGRIATTDYSNNNPLMMVKGFTDFSGRARRICGTSNNDCYSKQMYDQIVDMVKSNPYYQKQCGQN